MNLNHKAHKVHKETSFFVTFVCFVVRMELLCLTFLILKKI